jgi:hypothetical protein
MSRQRGPVGCLDTDSYGNGHSRGSGVFPGHSWFTSGCPHCVVTMFPAEKGLFMVVCTVCGDAFWPTARWHDETCQPCFDMNFAAAQELRVHEGDAPPTDRQRTALERLATAHAREEEHHCYVQAALARQAMRSRMAQEEEEP